MKSILQKLIGSLAVVLMTAVSVYAQVPQGFNFQAVARGANGEILADQALGVKVSVIKGTEEGNPVYEETHGVTTNPLGLIQIVIGEGTAAEGQNFSAIDFGNDNYFVKLAIDPAGGTEYADLGITRLLSVPYALVAQKAVEGGSGDFSLDLGLNTTGPDTSFVINIEGDKTAKPFQVFSSSSGYNGAIWGQAISETSNPNNQRGVLGIANGEGTGSHIGVFGSAVNYEATGQNRLGLYGQSASKAKFNYGAQALAQGDGSGDVVQIGEEVDGNFGSFNIAGGFYSQGNLNGNIGVEGIASGDKGARVNIGVEGGARAAASSRNLGVSAYAQNSLLENIAFLGRAESGSARNVGMKLFVNNGLNGANVGAEIFADTAAILHGQTVINGDLTVNGIINGSVGSGSANGQTLDSLFISTQPEAEFQRNTDFYPGFIRNSDQNGEFVTLTRKALQYGDTESDGTGNVFNWYNKGGMQVANNDYLNGERSAGMSGGYFYMDIAQNDNFYLPLEFGISNATEGGRSFFRMNSLARAENELGPLYEINISNDPNGTDPDGESAYLILIGDNTPNIQLGGQSWNNNELPYLNLFGSTEDGNGWYHSNLNISVDSDGTDEWTTMNFAKTNIVGQTTQQTINFDGNSGNITISGALSQSSDIRLKKDIQTLDNTLNKTLKMRGVSYNWKTDVSNENPQIGVIAQEVEEIYPEFVQTDAEGMKSVNYAQMTAVLIEAVKALNTKIETLENENKILQTHVEKMDSMKAELNKIWTLLEKEAPTTVVTNADK